MFRILLEFIIYSNYYYGSVTDSLKIYFILYKMCLYAPSLPPHFFYVLYYYCTYILFKRTILYIVHYILLLFITCMTL